MQFNITQKTFDEMLASLRKVLQFDTIKSPAKENMPFGEGNAKCLNFVLDLAKGMGFETYNCDNYAGHADFGHGEEIFGILGHLDVVPVAEKGWKAPPFAAEIIDGYLYGRGVLDDKGPMIACLYAVKQLMDEGFCPGKKIRLIFGCDEESGWGCMDYYAKKVKLPGVGISPDGDFPVINVEKGVCHLLLDAGKLPDGLTINGGQRANIVLDECAAVVDGGIKVYRKADSAQSDINGDLEVCVKDGKTTITAYGKSAHGSTPQVGDNASWKLFKALKALYPDDQTINFVCNKICGDFYGESWGLPLQDAQSGKMTINVGFLRTECGRLHLGLDIRYPVSYTQNEVLEKITQNSPDGVTFKVQGRHDPLYVPSDSKLVQTLLKIYNDATGQNDKPLAVGGATYARALPMGVAFGPVFPDDEKVIHETNERVSLDRLRLMTELYYQAVKELCK